MGKKRIKLGEYLERCIERNEDGTIKSFVPVWVFVDDCTSDKIKTIYGSCSSYIPGANPEEILVNSTKAMLSSCVTRVVKYRNRQFCDTIPNIRCDIYAIFISPKLCTDILINRLSSREFRRLPIPVFRAR